MGTKGIILPSPVINDGLVAFQVKTSNEIVSQKQALSEPITLTSPYGPPTNIVSTIVVSIHPVLEATDKETIYEPARLYTAEGLNKVDVVPFPRSQKTEDESILLKDVLLKETAVVLAKQLIESSLAVA